MSFPSVVIKFPDWELSGKVVCCFELLAWERCPYTRKASGSFLLEVSFDVKTVCVPSPFAAPWDSTIVGWLRGAVVNISLPLESSPLWASYQSARWNTDWPKVYNYTLRATLQDFCKPELKDLNINLLKSIYVMQKCMILGLKTTHFLPGVSLQELDTLEGEINVLCLVTINLLSTVVLRWMCVTYNSLC